MKINSQFAKKQQPTFVSSKFVHFVFLIMYKDNCFIYFNIPIRSQEFVFVHYDLKLHLYR